MGYHSLIREQRRRWIFLCGVEAGSRNTHPPCTAIPSTIGVQIILKLGVQVGRRGKHHYSLYTLYLGAGPDVTQGVVKGARVIKDHVLLSERITF